MHHDEEMDKVIDKLLKMARDIVGADKMKEGIGLTKEETSFYHAIASPDIIKDLYKDQTLIEMVRKLTTELKENESID